MKIAFIGQKGIPAVSGGVETRVEELATRMAKEGHEVFVYVRNNYTDKDLKKYKGVNLIHLPSITSKNLDIKYRKISFVVVFPILPVIAIHGIVNLQRND